jgi:Protein of unknown function (DUF3108)
LKLSQILLCGLIFCANLVFCSNLAFAQPKSVQLEYEVTRDGKPFATVKESFTQDGKQYKIESITKGIGVYALFGERKLSSVGELTAQGLKPMHFELHQGDSGRKSLIADFDWAKSTLNMQVKGKTKTAVLEAGTQDLASYAYQFMFNPPLKSEVNVALTTGKKLNQYQYKVAKRGEALNAANAQFATTHLVSTKAEDESKKQLWLAQDQHYLLVRYRQLDENGATLEQTLTKIHVE